MMILSKDGKRVFTAGTEGEIFYWDISQGNTKGTRLTGMKKDVYHLILSKDEKLLFGGAEAGELFYWDISKNQIEGTRLSGPKLEVIEFQITPNGKWLFTGGDDGEILAYDITQLHLPGIHLYGSNRSIKKFRISPDGKTLFAQETSGVIFCFDITNIHSKKAHYGMDFFTIQKWPPVFQSDPHHSRSVVSSKKSLTIYEHSQKFQTLYFPREITAWRLSNDGNTLIVSADKATFCWRCIPIKSLGTKKFSLIWDNGDELFCQGATLNNVKGLAPTNQRVMEQNGAVVVVAPTETQETPTTTTSTLTANDAKTLQKQLMSFLKKKEIEKTRQEIDNEIEDINQKLVAFYEAKEKEDPFAFLKLDLDI